MEQTCTTLMCYYYYDSATNYIISVTECNEAGGESSYLARESKTNCTPGLSWAVAPLMMGPQQTLNIFLALT